MKKIIGFIFLLCINTASATIIDFEENWSDFSLSNTYNGFNFSSNWSVWNDYSSSAYPQGSGTDAIFILPESPVNIISFSNGLFDLNSVWLATNTSASFIFRGYDAQSNLLYTSNTYSNSFVGTVNLGWTNIAYFDISTTSFASRYFILDDINYNSSSISVPEPTSLAILSIALIGISFSRKKKHS